ncbi:MBL fold metallo-hydrolase [Mesorhizobium australicum]|uniref:Glyoxylase, beta-lactamase superfamily II n=1 Tax=Mesorhizobium australicum TaxID=536018 RepID=A0A1X7PR28_9HYPH|nr:MBL fold metallo-hydrolase [Mesorhizobium australicum]SMH53556.1 Glyoxylase, beta-lactamase superfamily II [Mesorhizobium australicum]
MTPDEWYHLSDAGHGVTRLTEPYVDPYYSANLYFVRGRDRDLLVDAGMGILPLKPVLPLTQGKPVLALATHVHVDHVGALHEFADRAGLAAETELYETMPDEATYAEEYREREAPVTRLPMPGWKITDYRLQPAPLTLPLQEGDRVDLGDRSFAVLELPGHSPCIALFDEANGVLFAGDAIYDDLLLDDMPCSDKVAYRATMRRLIEEVDAKVVFGGHGEPFDGARMREIARNYLENGSGV